MRFRNPILLLSLTLLSLVFAGTTACSPGGGSTPGQPAVDPPRSLAYATNPAVYTLGQTIAANVPSHAGGGVAGYAVAPGLPAGLALDPVSGILTGTPTTLASTATYIVTASNGGGSTTATLTLTVNPAPVAPTFTTQPASISISAGQAAHFAVSAAGTPAPTLRWQTSVNGTTWADLGATGNTYDALAVTLADDGRQFRVVASNTAGTVNSSVAVLTVTAAAVAPVFTLQPVDLTLTEGQNGQFVVAVTGTPTPTLDWQVSVNNGAWFSFGVTTPVYDVWGPMVDSSGRRYRAVASNAAGTVASNPATLTVIPATVAPVFTTQPANATITAGQNAQFVVAASGVPTPTLQWQVSTNSGVSWSDISGETGATFMATSVPLSNNGWQFRAVATNGGGSVNSLAAVLTVNPASPLANIVFQRGYGIQSSPNDLFLIKEDGSGEIPIADSADDEVFLAIAPGGRIVYRRIAGGLTHFYSVNADGTGTVLLVSSISPDDFPIFNGITPGGWIVYRRDSATNGRDIYAVKADGTSSTPVPIVTTVNNDDFIAITDSGKIIYSVNRYNGNDLYAINADGTGNTPLAIEPNMYKGYKGQTPSGQLVIDTDNGYGFGSVYSIDEAGGSVVTLATNSVAYEYTFAGITGLGQIIISRSVGGQLDLYGNGTVALANSGDEERFRGSTASGQVIYQRTTGGTQIDLYVVNADGNGTTLLTGATGDDYFSALTPDGRLIYTKVTAGQYDIFMVNADGTGNVPVAASSDFEDYKGMTPDGHVIYERTGASGITSLHAFNPGDNVTTPLATSGGHAFFIATTPNNKVLFRRQSGNADLYIVNADGTGTTPLAISGNNEFFTAIFQ